jgi:hypothetical protein
MTRDTLAPSTTSLAKVPLERFVDNDCIEVMVHNVFRSYGVHSEMILIRRHCISIATTLLSHHQQQRRVSLNCRRITLDLQKHPRYVLHSLFQTNKQSQSSYLSLIYHHCTGTLSFHCTNYRCFTSITNGTDSIVEQATTTKQPLVSPTMKELVTTIPHDNSHLVTVSNDLVNIAIQNSLAVKNSRRRASSRHYNDNVDDTDSNRGYIESLFDYNEGEDDDEGNDEDDSYEIDGDQTSTERMDLPLITYEGEETYFQFDYRNHTTAVNAPMSNLLRKIETTLFNAHLEPFGRYRGVATLKHNIEIMNEGVKFRLGRGRSLQKDGVIVPKRKKIQNTTGYIQLKRALLRLLKDRQAIYGSGNTNTITELKWKQIGRSFFGPDSDICISYQETEDILRDLWFRGKSDKFNHLQKWHFRLVQKKKEQLLHPRDPNEPITPKAKKQKRYLPKQSSKNRFLWNDRRIAEIERQIKCVCFLYINLLSV